MEIRMHQRGNEMEVELELEMGLGIERVEELEEEKSGRVKIELEEDEEEEEEEEKRKKRDHCKKMNGATHTMESGELRRRKETMENCEQLEEEEQLGENRFPMKRNCSPICCAKCNQLIRDKFIFSVIDLHWHQECVQCSVCCSNLSERCYTFEGKLYCKEDYWQQFGPKCFECLQPIGANELVQRIKGNRIYHLKCFNCVECGRRLEFGEQLHLIEGGRQLLCKRDFLLKQQLPQSGSGWQRAESRAGEQENSLKSGSTRTGPKPQLTTLVGPRDNKRSAVASSEEKAATREQSSGGRTRSDGGQSEGVVEQPEEEEEVDEEEEEEEGREEEDEEEVDEEPEDEEPEEEEELLGGGLQSGRLGEGATLFREGNEENDSRPARLGGQRKTLAMLGASKHLRLSEQQSNGSARDSCTGGRLASAAAKRKRRRKQAMKKASGQLSLGQQQQQRPESILTGQQQTQSAAKQQQQLQSNGSILAHQKGPDRGGSSSNSNSNSNSNLSSSSSSSSSPCSHSSGSSGAATRPPTSTTLQPHNHHQLHTHHTLNHNHNHQHNASQNSNHPRHSLNQTASLNSSSHLNAHQQQQQTQQQQQQQQKPTRVRTVLNEKQLQTLRECYAHNPRPDALMKEQLVDMTGLSPRVIRVWFQVSAITRQLSNSRHSLLLDTLFRKLHFRLALFELPFRQLCAKAPPLPGRRRAQVANGKFMQILPLEHWRTNRTPEVACSSTNGELWVLLIRLLSLFPWTLFPILQFTAIHCSLIELTDEPFELTDEFSNKK